MVVKVYIKQHQRQGKVVFGVCDEDLIGKMITKDKFQFHVSETFFGGDLVLLDAIIPFLTKCNNFNAVGENVISHLIKHEIVHPKGVTIINGIPIALKFF
jgi:hypothetical protein